jgi:hypothetical protein
MKYLSIEDNEKWHDTLYRAGKGGHARLFALMLRWRKQASIAAHLASQEEGVSEMKTVTQKKSCGSRISCITLPLFHQLQKN